MRDEMRTAVVTGASSGIGKALAHQLRAKGYRLLLSGRNREALCALASERDEVLVADLSQQEGVEAVREAIRRFQPDLVINNAGLGYFGEPSSEAAHEIIQVNVAALVELTLVARDTFLQKKSAGTIVNVASVLAFFPTPQMSVYAASKAFVRSFSEALDFELEGTGIRVLTTCPGQVESDFRKRASHGKAVAKPSFFRMTAEEAAQAIMQQIEEGTCVKVVNFRARLLYWFARLLPQQLVWRCLSRDIKQRLKGQF